VHIGRLSPHQLEEARTLLVAALPHDRVGVVAAEKLFGENGSRIGINFAAQDGQRLVGVMATADRWLKLIAVAASHRRRGIASAMVGGLAALYADKKLRVGDHPGNYLSPGVDERYAEAHAFFAARRFSKVSMVENVRAPLDRPLQWTNVPGYEIRRVDAPERERVLAFVSSAFHPIWAFEVARALDGPRRAVHAAWASGDPVAFAAADGNNQGLGWFGPAGTAPEHRGKRLGEALLVRCLEDVRGLPEAGVIAWIGPKEFYRKTVGAVDDRHFVIWEQT
jgi:GNAT superfamily N-acetyltransferase